MSDLRNIDLGELSKASNPFHVNVCEFDFNRIQGAYPQMIVTDMLSSFNHQTNEYITKQLITLNIDKDVLIKQTQELNRLNSHIQELCNKARADERAKTIEEFATKMCESIDQDNAIGWRTSKDDVIALKVAMLEQNCTE